MSLASRLSPELRGRTPPEVLALLEAMQAHIDRLTAQVADLQAQLNRNSTNSSQPPSADAPAARARRPQRPSSGRKPGGQPGHAYAERPLLPEDRVDEVVVVKPEVCAHCHAPLAGDDPWYGCHQVTELPPLRPVVTEYRLHTLTCTQCGQQTAAPLPPGVPTRSFGPRLQATVAVNSGCYHLSKRQTQQQLQDSYGVTLSLGAISDLEQATSAALAAPVEEARHSLHSQDDVHLDETGWRQGNGSKKAWLWTALTASVTVFLIRLSRGAAVAKELLGEHFVGIVHSDRWSAYNWLPNRLRQLCWAHLGRDFQALAELGGEAGRIGQRLLDLRAQLFAWWHQVRDGTLSWGGFRMDMGPVIREVGDLLRQGRQCAQPKARGMCADILKREHSLWTFVWRRGVEPTNNAAERAVRPAVLWRKGSFGTQSAAGSEFVSRILTVVMTCRQQQRNVLEYVTAACAAAIDGKAAPSLLPSSALNQAAG
jgi:transposase